MWSNKNPITGSPSVLSYSLNSDFSILAYIDNNNNVYVSKYDGATDIYINPKKVTLGSTISSTYSIKLSPDGTILTIFELSLYVYRYNQVSNEYVYDQ